ncbi:12376_t:CDS:1 [Dentiscutata erythropus]|uniref:12376_t:CDS:1 n=1 Tax=Dentiscutata erythropus TaxID=1348616 RepID=A0A9N9I7R9_9GLOM|nr:12376_t:CDS:1 [Dentiscutata erythropus]
MTKTSEIEKRQSTQSICQRVRAGGTGQLGMLLCCDNTNSTNCLANPPTCTNVNKLVQCWSIKGLDACISRNDTTSQGVCSHQNDDGIFCLEGNTDRQYNNTDKYASAVNYMLSRYTAKDSVNGANCESSACPQIGCDYVNLCRKVNYEDSLASGGCQVANDLGGTDPLYYQVEICGTSYDTIIAPQASSIPINTYVIRPSSTVSNPSIASNPSNSGPKMTPSASISNNNSSSGANPGVTAAIVITVLIVTIIFSVIFYKVRKGRERDNSSPTTSNADTVVNNPIIKGYKNLFK